MAMTLRLTEEQDRVLTSLANTHSMSKQEAAIWAIEEQASRASTAADVQQWADHALVRYEALLDRLAQ